MSSSRKRRRDQLKIDQDEIPVEEKHRFKRKKGNSWEAKNLSSKEVAREDTEEGVSCYPGTVKTTGIQTNKVWPRDKDIYDISSSESEKDQHRLRTKSYTLGRIKATSTPNKIFSDAQVSAESNVSRKRKETLETVEKKQGDSKSSHVTWKSSTEVEVEQRESKKTVYSEKTTPVVEIRTLGSVKKSTTQKARKAPKEVEIKSPLGNRINKSLDVNDHKSTSRKKSNRPSKACTGSSTKLVAKDSKLVINLPSEKSSTLHSETTGKRSQATQSRVAEASIFTLNTVSNLNKRRSFVPGKDGTTPKNDLDLGFKDLSEISVGNKLPNKIQSTMGVTTNLNRREDDDTACEICHRYDSKKRNPMLLCDGCDSGYHIKCIGLIKEPQTEEWFCQKCQTDQVRTQNLGSASRELVDTLPEITNFEHHLKSLQRRILDKLTGKTPLRPKNLQDEMQKIYQMVQQTVLAGEGNSMLIIGSRGTGKSRLVDHVISDISIHHKDKFHVIRLNGFIHTDDKIALKEIWRQLGRELKVDDDDPTARLSNYTDILVSLLALLSHPSEISEAEPNQIAKSVIFILDEFDHFTAHHRQTLLYILFDIAQSKKAPILVLGLTTKIDATERLEKRVKSRFSHRFVYLSPPRSLPEYWEICREGLTLNDLNEEHKSIEMLIPGYQKFLSFWHAAIDQLYNKDVAFMHHIQSIYYKTKSIPAFLNSCILPIANLSPQNPLLYGVAFQSNDFSLSEPDSKLHLIQGLSELELALLIAAARLDVILDIDTCNFDMAYEEYSSLTSRHKIQTSSTGVMAIGAGGAKIWGRQVSLDAWENLAQYELIIPVTAVAKGVWSAFHGTDSRGVGCMWKVDVSLEEIPGSVHDMSTVMIKWCREV